MKDNTLKNKAVVGAKWNSVSIVYTTVVQFVTTAFLARVLSPSDFGLIGMMYIVIRLIGIFADAGINNAIIHHQDVTREQLSTLYWLNLLSGIGVYLAILLISPLTTILFKEPRVSGYLPWISLSILISTFGQQFSVLLRKDLQFKAIAYVDMAGVSLSTVGAITLALMGFGIWSLIFQPIVSATARACAFFAIAVRYRWLPKAIFNWASIRRFIGFGLFQIGERFVNSLYATIDCFVIGRFVGTEALGFYTLAIGLVRAPLKKINPIVTRVAFPTFARVQLDNSRLRMGYLKIIRYISACTFPVMAGMFMVAPLFVPLVYGAKWTPAVPIVQILCVVGILQSMGNPMGSLLLAKGRADIGFYLQIFALVVMVFANLIGAQYGLTGVAWSVLIVVLLIMWPVGFFIRWSLVKMTPAPYLASLKLPAFSSGLMMLLLWCVTTFTSEMTLIWNLVLQILIGCFFYTLLIWLLARPFCMEVRRDCFPRIKVGKHSGHRGSNTNV